MVFSLFFCLLFIMKPRERHSLELPVSSNIPIHHEDTMQHWKKWQYLAPRWSSPELSSTSSTTTASVVSQQDKHCDWDDETSDEEKTIGDADHDHHMDEAEKKALISLCKSLMLYGAPCHRIVCALAMLSCLICTHRLCIRIRKRH